MVVAGEEYGEKERELGEEMDGYMNKSRREAVLSSDIEGYRIIRDLRGLRCEFLSLPGVYLSF